MKKVFISTSTFAQFSNEPINILKDNGVEIILNEKGRKLTYDELVSIIYEFEGVIAGTETYDKPLLEKAEKLKVISRLGVGTDNIDLSVMKNKNISLFTTKTNPAPVCSELVIGLILDLHRNISRSNEMLKDGKWVKMMGSLIRNKTLGIIGLESLENNWLKQ